VIQARAGLPPLQDTGNGAGFWAAWENGKVCGACGSDGDGGKRECGDPVALCFV